MPLDSDTANADANLIVEFYTQTKGTFEGKPFVKIMVPGDKTNIIDTLAREDHKRRFPLQWIHYQSKNDGSALIGTPLTEWSNSCPGDVSDYQLQELSILKFQTVEQVATMSDSQAQKVGMGGVGLREKAQTYLRSKNQKASSSELESTKAELETIKAQMAELMASMNKPKRGRPPSNPVE